MADPHDLLEQWQREEDIKDLEHSLRRARKQFRLHLMVGGLQLFLASLNIPGVHSGLWIAIVAVVICGASGVWNLAYGWHKWKKAKLDLVTRRLDLC